MSDRLARLIEAEVLSMEDDQIEEVWDDFPSDYWDDVECSTCGGRCVL